MRSVDRQVMLMLDDLEQAIFDLRRIYPSAVASSESVKVASSSSGVPIRSSGVSDPTGDAATDPRRQRRQSRVKQSRKEIRASLTSAHSALANVIKAAE